jgi:hypothetical protein
MQRIDPRSWPIRWRLTSLNVGVLAATLLLLGTVSLLQLDNALIAITSDHLREQTRPLQRGLVEPPRGPGQGPGAFGPGSGPGPGPGSGPGSAPGFGKAPARAPARAPVWVRGLDLGPAAGAGRSSRHRWPAWPRSSCGG